MWESSALMVTPLLLTSSPGLSHSLEVPMALLCRSNPPLRDTSCMFFSALTRTSFSVADRSTLSCALTTTSWPPRTTTEDPERISMFAAALKVMRPSAITISEPQASRITTPPSGVSPMYECLRSYFSNSSDALPSSSYCLSGHLSSD